MNAEKIILDSDLKTLPLFKKGKVREVYDLGDKLLVVATDRISAFDYILPNGIPFKGKVLTGLSLFWFKYLNDIVKNHFISSDVSTYSSELQGRAMVVHKASALPVECVVRGYLSGSGWKEYKQNQSICGIKLKSGHIESDRLSEPIFTPTTKAETGHDENIDYNKVVEMIGEKWAKMISETSINLYKKAHEYALTKGIIIADTKFEFGIKDDKLMLIDEVLTPDSSRFWPKDLYKPGKGQPSFDKQFVRDYLEGINWDKQPPVPQLPSDIIKKTSEKYLEAYKFITGSNLCN
jgi:phosphoribosylaminoimidazole-succinocarboxamide synthase